MAKQFHFSETSGTAISRRTGNRPWVLSLPLVLLIGCVGPSQPPIEMPKEEADAPEVVRAQNLFDHGRLQDAVNACVDIQRKNPEARGLHRLQTDIRRKLAEERMAKAKDHSQFTSKASNADAERFSSVPDTYLQNKYVMGETASLRSAPTEMQKVLEKKISINLNKADINAIIAQIGQSEDINIVADSEVAESEKQLSIVARDTPLIEILEYIGRNLGVTFSVGKNLIWVTPKEEQTIGVPMETRVYKLRKGLLGSELGKSAKGDSLFKGPEERRGSRSSSNNNQKQENQQEGKIGLMESIERFVPQPEGADFLFNDRVHALIVKNTRENLALVEDLIDAMDVRPVQILIEARFVSTTITDLSKLGVEWLIDNRGNARFDSSVLPTRGLVVRPSSRTRVATSSTGRSRPSVRMTPGAAPAEQPSPTSSCWATPR